MAVYHILYCIFLTFLAQSTRQLSTPESDSYIAAVVEYAALGDAARDKPVDIIRRNFQNYLDYIQQAANQNVDIIVFPECGLTTMGVPSTRPEIRPWLTRIPDPTTEEIPCTANYSDVPEILRNVSCAARDHQLYIVINLWEEAPCSVVDPECPSDGAFFYNTNVAFDRNGTVVARYRKFNLFVEPGFNVTPTAELSTFDTDFGVRFGTFICFDLLFRTPAVQLVKQLGITDIAFSTAWYSELPYLTADEVQAAWAYALDVNLLASGFNNPANGNAGSGIYGGRLGALQDIMPLTKTSRMLVRQVHKKPARSPAAEIFDNNSSTPTADGELPEPLPLKGIPISNIGGLRLFQDDFRQYNTVLLDTNTSSPSGNTTRHRNIDLCHGDFCCHFDVTTDSARNTEGDQCAVQVAGGGYYYRLGVFDGIRNFAGVSVAGIQVCGIIPCTTPDNITTCGKAIVNPSPAVNVVFKSIRITGENFLQQESLQMPATLLETLLPLPSSFYEFTVQNARTRGRNDVYLRTKKEINSLLGLALYGRVFSRDARTTPLSPHTSSTV